MKAIVGYERSGALRSRLRALGVDAWSCDLAPAEDGDPHHLQGDVWTFAPADCWDFGIFHPTCTYLTGSAAWAFGDGPYHQKVRPETLVGQARREAREAALANVRRLMALPYPHAIENQRGFIGSMVRRPDQTLQPYQFGEDASKATCLWLSGLPPLRPTGWVEPRTVNGRPRWANQTDAGQNRLSPANDRWIERSRTYPGIADAMARQWTAWMEDMN